MAFKNMQAISSGGECIASAMSRLQRSCQAGSGCRIEIVRARAQMGSTASRRQHPPQPRQQPALVLLRQFMLPNPEYFPTHGAQRPVHEPVAGPVGGKFVLPKLRVLPRNRDVLLAPMPEAAVNEDREFPCPPQPWRRRKPWKNKIRPDSELWLRLKLQLPRFNFFPERRSASSSR